MEIFQVFSLIAAYFASKLLYTLPANTIFAKVTPETLRLFLSHAVMFIGTFIVALLIFAFIRKIVTSDGHVEAVDRTMGILWGTVKGILTVELILILILKFDILKRDFIAGKSIIGKLLIALTDALHLI